MPRTPQFDGSSPCAKYSVVSDYHVRQLDQSQCAGYNCAAASGAMAIWWQTGEQLTGAQFRAESGASCVPGEHSGSGGLYISDVIRVVEAHGGKIDYGPLGDPPTAYTRWAPPELHRRLSTGYGACLLGDYDALPKEYRASGTFLGDHSVWVHGLRTYAGVDEIHWHDPLRTVGIWIPITAAISYWQKPSSPIRGYAGFVLLREVDVTITAIKGEDWQAAERKPVRNAPSRTNEAIVGHIEAGGIIRTLGEATSADGNVWRLTEYGGKPGWILRSDFAPLVPGGDPKVDQGLSDYLARKATDCSAAVRAEYDRVTAGTTVTFPERP